MLKIYVCEDNEIQLKKLDTIIENIIETENLDIEKGCITANPKVIIDAVEHDKNTGLFFLDIDLGCDINGLELAKQIRKIQPRCYIVFITTHSEMSFLTFSYKVEALDFILKDNQDELLNRVKQCVVLAFHRNEMDTINPVKKLTLRIGEHVRVISQDQIKYFEFSTKDRKIVMHGVDTIMEFPGKLKDIEKSVDERFVRCHKSFIVNKEFIEDTDLTKRIVYIKGGEICPVSVRFGKKLNLFN